MSSSKKSPARRFSVSATAFFLTSSSAVTVTTVVQDDAVVLAEVTAVLDHGEERADAVRGDDRVHLDARADAVHTEREVLAVGAAVADLAPEVGDELAAEVAPVG